MRPVVPVVFPKDNGFGCTKDVCGECWTELDGGARSERIWSKRSRTKEEGLRFSHIAGSNKVMPQKDEISVSIVSCAQWRKTKG